MQRAQYQTLDSQAWSTTQIVALVATASLTVGVTAGLTAASSTPTQLYAPVATATTQATGVMQAAVPVAPRQAVHRMAAAPVAQEAYYPEEFEFVQPPVHQTGFQGVYAAAAGLLMVPAAMFAWFKSQTVAKPLLPTSQWAMAAEAGAEGESAPARRATMQFIRGIDETDIPDVKLKRSRDGSSGSAVFTFNNASLFDAQIGEVSGLYMTDEEGTISTTQCTAKFVNGNPSCVEATYVMRSPAEWDRYMRFMERYAEENGLGFSKSS